MERQSFSLAENNEILIEQCRKGNNAACRQLYELYARAMFNICLRMLNNYNDAEDVLQDAFLQVFKNIKAYRGEASIGSWIKRIVINNCINYVRKRKIHWEPADGLEMQQEDDTIDEQKFSLTVNHLKKAIQQLPDGYRVVLTMYLMEDYSHKEIANLLGISESTAKTQYMRAKEKVRRMMPPAPKGE